MTTTADDIATVNPYTSNKHHVCIDIVSSNISLSVLSFLQHNRKEIPCYWENQATGCQKPHCAFFHEKPRYIEGVFVSPDKSEFTSQGKAVERWMTNTHHVVVSDVGKNVEQPQEEPASIQPPPPNSQRRETVKMDTQVPSPTHPPVVINPAEDEDEDEDGGLCLNDLCASPLCSLSLCLSFYPFIYLSSLCVSKKSEV